MPLDDKGLYEIALLQIKILPLICGQLFGLGEDVIMFVLRNSFCLKFTL
jgi:hypothetical protein